MHFYKLTGSSSCEPGSIKLQSRTGDNPAAGYLLMCDNTPEWRAVCGYPWDANRAKVACRQLGFSDRGNHYKALFLYYCADVMIFMLPKGAEFCIYFLDNTLHEGITVKSCAGNETKLMGLQDSS